MWVGAARACNAIHPVPNLRNNPEDALLAGMAVGARKKKKGAGVVCCPEAWPACRGRGPWSHRLVIACRQAR